VQTLTVLFLLRGDIIPMPTLAKAAGKSGTGRSLGGWLTTYGKIGPDGGIIPTVDRDRQTFDAARELGHIDWSQYLTDTTRGFWNDTHRDGVVASPRILVGVPRTLEFHDGSTELSLAHGKVGFWTTGHLWDRDDPSSWEDWTDYTPTDLDLERADYYWTLANTIMHNLARKLALSAHGSMRVDLTRRHITWAQITQAAVCEVPRNPDSTLDIIPPRPTPDEPLTALAKAVSEMDSLEADLASSGIDLQGQSVQSLLERIQEQYLMTPDEAREWLRKSLQAHKERRNA
jgi:hypothetical protein